MDESDLCTTDAIVYRVSVTAASQLALEWQTLQHNQMACESSTLWIRLFAMLLCFVALALGIALVPVACLLMLLWVQEAMVRTTQSRLLGRLDVIESLLANPVCPSGAFALHTQWHTIRGTTRTLLAQYARQMARPTVALPYAGLLALLAAVAFLPV